MIEIGHRRWGKDEIALNMAATSAFLKPATYWHMLPEYSQARKAIWNAIDPHTNRRRIDDIFPQEIRENTNEHEMFIRFKNGATWQVVGSDSYKSLVGAPPYGIVFSEWSKANPSAWAYLSPILEENNGWALFITTPEAKNHAYRMYNMAKENPRWFAELQTVEDTGFSLEKVDAARKEYYSLYGIDAGEALIQQEYYCSFESAVLGAVYGKEMARVVKEGRISPNVKHDPNFPVYVAFDLGRSDATVMWFFQVGYNEILLIDYFESSFLSVKEICEIIYGKKIKVNNINNKTYQIADWEFEGDLEGHAHRKHYQYNEFLFVPADAAHKLQAAGGRSIIEQAREFGIKFMYIPETTHQQRHAALRATLEKCWFNSDKCERGIEALKCYHFAYKDDKNDYGKEPVHDWSSHAATALELMARVWREKILTVTEINRQKTIASFKSKRINEGLEMVDPYRIQNKLRK